MATLQINGQTYTGDNINIAGGSIIIDGNIVQSNLTGIQEIRILDGSVNNVTSTASVNCGEVRGSVDAGGSVTCGDVHADGDAGGSVKCGNVGGNVDSGGSTNCGNVTGDVDAGGSINMKR